MGGGCQLPIGLSASRTSQANPKEQWKEKAMVPGRDLTSSDKWQSLWVGCPRLHCREPLRLGGWH